MKHLYKLPIWAQLTLLFITVLVLAYAGILCGVIRYLSACMRLHTDSKPQPPDTLLSYALGVISWVVIIAALYPLVKYCQHKHINPVKR